MGKQIERANPLYIKYNTANNTLNISFLYKELILTANSVQFSTFNLEGSINGFIEVADSLFLKLTIGQSPRNFTEKALPQNVFKLEVNTKKKEINWTITTEGEFVRILSGEIMLECSSFFSSNDLKDIYFELVLTSRNPIPKLISENNTVNKTIKQRKANDFKSADRFTYLINPNIDGFRSKNELFGGTGSNMSKRQVKK